MGAGEAGVVAVDPFELPDWLGTSEVTWTTDAPVRGSTRVSGELVSGPLRLACDLLAVDEAYPRSVLPEPWRRDAHGCWKHGQVLLVEQDGRLTLAVPGTGLSAETVLEVLARLARAVGAEPSRYVAALRA